MSRWHDDLPPTEPQFMRKGPAAPAAEPERMVEAAGVVIDHDEDAWRPLTGDAGRDLSPITQERMQQMVHWLWERNPIINRMIELPLAFLIAEGVTIKCADDDCQQIIDAFWSDPINDLDLNLENYVRELAMYGEQCWVMFTNEMSGATRMGYLDPRLIDQVVMDPDNPRVAAGVITKRDRKGKYKKYRVIYPGSEEELFTARTQALRAGFADGECFFWTVNRTASGKRGRSDVLHAADWGDAYEQYLYGEIERWNYQRAYVWDITVTGLDQKGIDAYARLQPKPSPGAEFYHNEAVTRQAISPTLNAADGSIGARMIRNHVLGGGSIPEHWFGGGGDVNRAVGAEMGEPVYKIMSLRQRRWKHILENLCRWVLFKRLGATRTIDYRDELLQVEAVFPELTAKDTTKWAAALQQVVASVVVAINEGILTQETGVAMISTVAGRLGIEFDAAEELAAAVAEAEERRARQAEQDNFTGPDPATADDAAQAAALGNAAADTAANVAAQT
jgi:hypothetical protein